MFRPVLAVRFTGPPSAPAKVSAFGTSTTAIPIALTGSVLAALLVILFPRLSGRQD